ncbi:MAG: GNAT family N-acetyltransferase [Muribaculaceae bacterium]|nr:GNAT family N-acetyltransferase [Muribaculaceae bacterium]
MIETDRLLLRPWSEEDAEALFKYASDLRVSELALWPCHTSVDMSREVIRRFFIPNQPTLAMELKSTGEPIGCIGLVPMGEEHYTPLTGEREIGYWIGHPHWSKGLTTEALMAFTPYCFNEMGLNSLLITTDRKNTGSQRVAEKCGFSLIDRYVCDGIASLAFRLRQTQ